MLDRGTWWYKAACGVLLIIVAMTASGMQSAHARVMVDMAGRTVTIHDAKRVWPAYPPVMHLVYAIDPNLLAGWTMPVPDSRYIRVPDRNLPVVGGWFGQRTPNIESLIALKPDLALAWDQTVAARPDMVEKLNKLNIPVVAVRIFRLSDYPDAFRFLGDVLERRQRAEKLAVEIEQTIRRMKQFSSQIPNEKKVSVYFALGPDGLTNDCDHMPFLDEAIQLAGGRNVYRCTPNTRTIGKKIDRERLLMLNPDVIVTQDRIFFSKVYSDAQLKMIKAVKDRRVYLVPNTPFNWLNYPPTYMRSLGVRWLAKTLYPDLYRPDIKKETKQFFKLFLNVDISEKEAGEILMMK